MLSLPSSWPPGAAGRPTNRAPLPRLLAYAQRLGLERYLLHRPKRGVPVLTLALAWLALAWRGPWRRGRRAGRSACG